MNRTALVSLLALVLVACGGTAPSDIAPTPPAVPPSQVPPASPAETPPGQQIPTVQLPTVTPTVPLACTHDGTFGILDTRTAATGACASEPAQIVSAAVVTVSGSTVTWTEDGKTLTGTLDQECNITLSYSDTRDGVSVLVERHLGVGPDLITGTTTETLESPDAGAPGYPCTATYDTGATRE